MNQSVKMDTSRNRVDVLKHVIENKMEELNQSIKINSDLALYNMHELNTLIDILLESVDRTSYEQNKND